MTEFDCRPAAWSGPRGLRRRVGRPKTARGRWSDRLARGGAGAAAVGAEDLARRPRQGASARHMHPADPTPYQGQRLLRSGVARLPRRRLIALAAGVVFGWGGCGARRSPAANDLAPDQPDEEGQEREVEQPDERQAVPVSQFAAGVTCRRCRPGGPPRRERRRRPEQPHGGAASRRRAVPLRAARERPPAGGRTPDRRHRAG